ncbi:hypothetical protein ACLQ2S_06540 [Micromonospora sp. DT48]|uniref:hypothetical protein n=1 Tax=Micromonospora sp. DT48 TaxID=3393429 RepID=UPI003CE9F78B
MAVDTTGKFWRGDDFTDLADYLREYQPGGYPVAQVEELICQRCGGRAFAVLADDEDGCAQTRCLTCGDGPRAGVHHAQPLHPHPGRLRRPRPGGLRRLRCLAAASDPGNATG